MTLARALGGAAVLTLIAAGSSGCLAENMLHQEVAIEEHPYELEGQKLSYFEGTATEEKGADLKQRQPGYLKRPVALFIEGDGGDCQGYDQAAWYRFIVRFSGGYVLVRPKGFVNVTCHKDAWKTHGFDARVDEVGVIVAALKKDHPGQPIVLIGHSAGAHVAALYAEKHPGDIAGIVDLAGGVDELSEVMRAAEREKGLGSKQLMENQRMLDATFEHLKSPDLDKPLWNRTERFWAEMLHVEVKELWKKIDVPVLVLHAEDDKTVPYALLPRAKREFKRSGKGNFTWTFIDGTGHDVLVSEVFLLVDDWIDRKIVKKSGSKSDD